MKSHFICGRNFACDRGEFSKMPTVSSFQKIFSLLILLTLFTTSVHSCGPGRGIGGPRRNRKLTPLVFKQHVPNMSENTLGASGLQEGKIKRDHPKFKDLVPNYNKDIIFKDEEGTGADRLMSQRCKEKLNTLAVSVMNQWPGVRLRVTESWDEDNLHGSESLHYEGRAVDITTSDRDRTKYGMLARLAVEAGFDWVYYESRAHIHCSVKSDASQSSYVSGCFPLDSTVLLSTGESKNMSELEIGDRVLSMTDAGNAVYSEVILFLDKSVDQVETFVRIHTENGAELTLTPAHLVSVLNDDINSPKRTYTFKFSEKVEIGDYVLVNRRNTSSKSKSSSSRSSSSDRLVPQKVVSITNVVGKGFLAPLTREGTIVVDSVATSCYAVVESHTLAHWALLPMRILSTIRGWFSKPSGHQPEQRGIHWYAQALYSLKDLVLPKSWFYQ